MYSTSPSTLKKNEQSGVGVQEKERLNPSGELGMAYRKMVFEVGLEGRKCVQVGSWEGTTLEVNSTYRLPLESP